MLLFAALLTIQQTSGNFRLPRGVTELDRPLVVPQGAFGLVISGPGATLRASGRFTGEALIVVRDGTRIEIRDLVIDGNRDAIARPIGLPPHDRTFAGFYPKNGILAERTAGLVIRDVRLAGIANFAVLVSASRDVVIERVSVKDSGSMNGRGRNNTTGGILIEEGTSNFRVERCALRDIAGNGIWTHSNYTSPRNGPGRIAFNSFYTIGRDAIQAGHASKVSVIENTGSHIGFPAGVVDVEGGGTPVAIDTAGDVDASVYSRNRFTEVNGKCIDLDGFHDGSVTANTCSNAWGPEYYPNGHYGIVFNNTNPDMQSENIRVIGNRIEGAKFGGIFLLGSGHTIRNNRLVRINTAGCNESHATFGCLYDAGQPDLLQAGIYIGNRAERPAVTKDNVVEGNLITGHKMAERCIAFAPGVVRSANRVRGNICRN